MKFFKSFFKRIKFGVFTVTESEICCIKGGTNAQPRRARVYLKNGIIHYLPMSVFEACNIHDGCKK